MLMAVVRSNDAARSISVVIVVVFRTIAGLKLSAGDGVSSGLDGMVVSN